MSSNPFFNEADLKDLTLQIQGVNSTSTMKFEKDAIQLTEIMVDGIKIEVPVKSCAVGHSLILDLEGRKPSKKSSEILVNKIRVLGVIEEISRSSETHQEVRVKLRNYSIKDWEELLSFFAEKQVSVNTLIKRTRK